MSKTLAFIIPCTSASDRELVMSKLDALRSLDIGSNAELIATEVLGARSNRFMCRVVVPIAIGVASNFATDVIRDAAAPIARFIRERVPQAEQRKIMISVDDRELDLSEIHLP